MTMLFVLGIFLFLVAILLVAMALRPSTPTEGMHHSLAVIEAMKMENILKADKDAVVKRVVAHPGESLAVDQVVIEFA